MLEKTLWHQSGVNRKGEPFVQLMLDDQVVCQLSPAEARDHASKLLEATEASEQDAFMLDFAKNDIGISEAAAVQLLQAFRRYREARGKKGPASDPKEFMITDDHSEPGDQTL
jgi:hypothetical protein